MDQILMIELSISSMVSMTRAFAAYSRSTTSNRCISASVSTPLDNSIERNSVDRAAAKDMDLCAASELPEKPDARVVAHLIMSLD